MAIAYVGEKVTATRATTQGNWTITVAANSTAGNTLVLSFSSSNAGVPLTSVVDSRGNTWTIDASATFATAVVQASTALNAGALLIGDTITAQFTNTTTPFDGAILVEEFSGLAVSSRVDQTTSGTNGSNTTITGGTTGTTAVASELVYSSFSANAALSSITPAAGYSAPTTGVLAVGTSSVLAEYQVVSSTGAFNPTATTNANSVAVGVTATYKFLPGPVPVNTVAPALSGPTNLIVNGGLETNAANWSATGGSTISRDTGTSKFGAASLKNVSPGTGNGMEPDGVSATPGVTYTGSVYVSAGTGETGNASIFFRDAGFVQTSGAASSSYTGAGPGVWQRLSFTAISGAGTAFAYLDISPNAAATYWVDGAQLEVGAIASPYIETNGAPVSAISTLVGTPVYTDNGTWTNSPTSFSYQWQRDNFGGASYSNIGGATASSHVLVDADDGCNIRCVVTASNINGASSGANSNSIGTIVEPDPVNTVAPVMSGTTTVGSLFTTTNGTWTGMGGHTATFTYQWQSATDAGFTTGISNISTASTYTITSTEVGRWIRVTVTATNDASAASKVSNIRGAITRAPTNTVAPVASGTAVVGSTVATTDGTWTDVPTGFTYQWQRDVAGNSVYSNIASATVNAYVLVDADDGCHVRCAVTATNATGSTTANSNALGLVAEPVPVNSSAPVTSGTPAQGQVLTTSNGIWLNMGGASPTFTYQWQRDVASFGAYSNIGSATSATYTLVTADLSCHVRCVVTAHNTGGTAAAGGIPLRPIYLGTLTHLLPGAPVQLTAVVPGSLSLSAVPAVSPALTLTPVVPATIIGVDARNG